MGGYNILTNTHTTDANPSIRLWADTIVTKSSQVTKAGIGSAECLTVVTDSETDLDTSTECLMALPVKVVPA